MLVCIFEDDRVEHFFPLTRTRAVYSLRMGRRTILDTIAETIDATGIVVHCRAELADVVREETGRLVNRIAAGVDVLFVNGRIVLHSIDQLAPVLEASRSSTPTVFVDGEEVIAAWVPAAADPGRMVNRESINLEAFPDFRVETLAGVALVSRIWDLLAHIEATIKTDFQVLTQGANVFERPDTRISDRADLVNGEQIFIAPGAEVRSGAVLDASDGPIIIDRSARVMEHAVIHGPVSIGEHATVKVGAFLESCVIGPWSKVAGEVHDSVIHSFSNKSHAGFMGQSYLGSWVNLGAHTNTSNLKNDYGIVSAFNEALGEMEKTDSIFAGLCMGDHSKCGIDSMFNTGTVVGVSCNLFGSGYQPRHIPSFLWGSPHGGYVTYRLDKALRVAETVIQRRNKDLSAAMRDLLTSVHEATESDRDRGILR